MTRLERSIPAAVLSAVVAAGALSVSAQSAPLKRPYVKKADFVRDVGEFDFEGPTVLEVVFAYMGAGGNVRICVSGVCRNVAARNRVVMSEDRFGQDWRYGQTRVVVIAACNRAGCMRPKRVRLRTP